MVTQRIDERDDPLRPDAAAPTGPKQRKRAEKTESGPKPAAALPRWESALERLGGRSGPDHSLLSTVFSSAAEREIGFVLNVRETRLRDQLVIDFCVREQKEDGAWGPQQPLDVSPRALKDFPIADRTTIEILLGNGAEDRRTAKIDRDAAYSRSVIRAGLYRGALSTLASSGRFVREAGLDRPGAFDAIRYDDGEPFDFRVIVESAEDGYVLWGRFEREDEVRALNERAVLLSGGLMLDGPDLVYVDFGEAFDWAYRLHRQGPIAVPAVAKDAFLARLATLPDLPEIELPPELHWSQVRATPKQCVAFRADEAVDGKYVYGRISFEYAGQAIGVHDRARAVADENGRRIFRRDRRAESKAVARLADLGLRLATDSDLGEVRVAAKDLSAIIKVLLKEGWHVDADESRVRSASGGLTGRVSSGIDWFDLRAEVDFGGVSVSLPELLEAARCGESYVKLSDGSRGLIPDWISKYTMLSQAGSPEGDKIRFLPSQAGIIDALLTGQQNFDFDVKFDRIRRRLSSPVSAGDRQEPEGFQGSLRDYQHDGLGWLRFLEASKHGGCLADDMGLGKTVQVLSWLQGRHRPEAVGPRKKEPSLIVVPRSLIYNWITEAKKFTPNMRVLDYTGSDRKRRRPHIREYDLVVTTYGTLRQDVLELLEFRFETIILDEAQAIKNARSQAAKACCLIQAKHRLAMSGTPVENRLTELWSIFEFLNPGILGKLDDFSAQAKVADEGWLDLLSRSLRPLILRRTKGQVLHELPEKTETTIMVDMGAQEQDAYDELRDYYRAMLSQKIEEVGVGKAHVHVLEALLRLRQASCHPGLLDENRMDESSAKIDVLFEKLTEVVGTGHKALVFSQFTTLLEIVRRQLEKRGIKYVYLDGATRDRQGVVEQFQSDPSIEVFLISLKAGGCGLNLTASDYVFILDPWWNPAVEAQAIDRAHRMGQKNPVFAYRLITEGSVEEKIAKLQEKKRQLADAIITRENSVLTSLSAADIEALLG